MILQAADPGAPSGVERRSGLPTLPLERPPSGALLGRWRRCQHSWAQPLCPTARNLLRAVVRQANGPTQQPASMAICSTSSRTIVPSTGSVTSSTRRALFSRCHDLNLSHRDPGRLHRRDQREPPGACFGPVIRCQRPRPRQRRTFAHEGSRRHSTGRACASTLPSSTVPMPMRRANPCRLCWRP